MTERYTPLEQASSNLEIRRDALLLRIAEMREKVKQTSLDPEIVSKELTELDTRLQLIQGSLDIGVYEDVIDFLEGILDSNIP